jgi:hypothetical protein
MSPPAHLKAKRHPISDTLLFVITTIADDGQKSTNLMILSIKGGGYEFLTGGRRNLHNEELHNLYSSPSIIRIIKSRTMSWAWHVVARMGEKRNTCRLLVRKPEGKRPLGKPRRRWLDGVVWTGLVWLRIRTSGEFLCVL